MSGVLVVGGWRLECKATAWPPRKQRFPHSLFNPPTMDPITLAAKTSSTDLFASAIPLMACVSPLSASSTRSKRSRENDADNDSLCEHESPTKKPTYQDDASSQRSITPLAFDHLEPTDDIRVQQHFTLPAPPCPSPADLETLSHSTQELLVQIAQLNTVKERLVREVRAQTHFCGRSHFLLFNVPGLCRWPNSPLDMLLTNLV